MNETFLSIMFIKTPFRILRQKERETILMALTYLQAEGSHGRYWNNRGQEEREAIA